MPYDINLITRIASNDWGSDGHHHSWLDVSEIDSLEKLLTEFFDDTYYFEDIFGNLFDDDWSGLYKNKDSYPKEIEDARFVFWFDN